MKHKFPLFFLAVAFVFNVNAQDQKAVDILEELSTKTKSYKNFSADFTMNLVDVQSDIDLTRKGKIIVSGDKYRVKLENDVIIGNGETRWTYQAESNEVYVDYEVADDGTGLNPSKIFTIWESGFKQFYEGETTVDGKAVHQINLHPIKPDETNYHTVKVFVDKAKMELIRVEVAGKEGDTYKYKLLDFKSNQEIPESTFTFSKSEFPGAEVIDMR